MGFWLIPLFGRTRLGVEVLYTTGKGKCTSIPSQYNLKREAAK
jgi:hypothetical protein